MHAEQPLSADHPAPPASTDSRVTMVAVAAGLVALTLGGLAWFANADAIFVELVNAALAMCM